jgi:Protein of unknown function (DUF3592)
LSPKTQPKWRGLVALMGLFAGLCTIFAFVVTVAEARREYAQAQWPEATARVERCGLHPTSTGRRDRYYIDCRLGYVVSGEDEVAKLYSRTVPSPETWQYPPNQIGPLQQWLDEHPEGTQIAVRYDPDNPKKAVLIATDTPLGGRRTPTNLRLLGFMAVSCIVLLAIARITRPQSA